MHTHSAEAIGEFRSSGHAALRNQAVIEVLERHRLGTDRQVAEWLGFSDLNAVRPRITELVKAGRLEEAGSTICPVTGRRVRMVRPAGQEPSDSLFPVFEQMNHTLANWLNNN